MHFGYIGGRGDRGIVDPPLIEIERVARYHIVERLHFREALLLDRIINPANHIVFKLKFLIREEALLKCIEYPPVLHVDVELPEEVGSAGSERVHRTALYQVGCLLEPRAGAYKKILKRSVVAVLLPLFQHLFRCVPLQVLYRLQTDPELAATSRVLIRAFVNARKKYLKPQPPCLLNVNRRRVVTAAVAQHARHELRRVMRLKVSHLKRKEGERSAVRLAE